MFGKRTLVVVPTLEEFSFFRDQISQRDHSSLSTTSIPTAGSSRGVIRLSVEDRRCGVWNEVYIVCLHGQAEKVRERFRRHLTEINPALVIIGGIAGGASSSDLSVGDLAISTILHHPTRVKDSPDGQQGVPDQERGVFPDQITGNELASSLSHHLTEWVRAHHRRPTDAEIVSAVDAQQPSAIDRDEAIARANARFDEVFCPVGSGVAVRHPETFSDKVNQQTLDGLFAKQSALNPALQMAEMEAWFLLEVMRDIGRHDQPLLVKCISDVPGFIRSDVVKDICRSLAAEAIFAIVEDKEFTIALKERTVGQDGLTVSRRSLPTLEHQDRLKGFYNQETLIRVVERPEEFKDVDVISLASAIAETDGLAQAFIDVLIHFAVVCPRCTRGAPPLIRLKPIFEAALHALVRQREIERVGQLAAIAPIYGIDTSVVGELDWRSLVDAVRTGRASERSKTALMGRAYSLMAVDLRSTLDHIATLRATGEFHDQAIAIWMFTAIAAGVSRGSDLSEIRSRFKPKQWDHFLEEYSNRNPYSYDLTSLIPVLQGRAHIEGLPGADGALARLSYELDKDETESELVGMERLMAVATFAATGNAKGYWISDVGQHATAVRSLAYSPLMPLTDTVHAIEQSAV